MTKDSLIKGTIILTLAAFTARFLGLIQRVPLKHLLGDSGMATYGISYNVYHVLLIVATAGIPSALSKLISERTALGQFEEAQRIYKAAVWFAITIGLIMTVTLWFSADYYAVNISRDPDAVLAIRALAPALLFFPLIAIMRGYFLGRQMMMAGGLSQIVEQFFRVITAVGLAYLILHFGYDKEWAIAGASFGGVTGGIAAFVVMLYFWTKLKERDRSTLPTIAHGPTKQIPGQSKEVEPRLPIRSIYATIFKFSIPVSLIAIAVPLIYLIDSSTVIALLEGKLGYEEAKETLGILTGRAQSLAGIPPILAIAISQSIIPIVSSAYAKSDLKQVNEQASQAFRISFLACLPIILFLCIAGRPINAFLFGDTVGTAVIIALVIGTAFHILMMISGAILLGLGQTKAPMAYVFIGIAVKLVGSYVLAPLFGIYGIILATALCFIVIMALNILSLKKIVTLRILGTSWWSLTPILLIVVAMGVGAEMWLHTYLHTFNSFLTYGIHASLLGVLVMALYVILLIKFRVITLNDVSRLPAPVRKVVMPLFGRHG